MGAMSLVDAPRTYVSVMASSISGRRRRYRRQRLGRRATSAGAPDANADLAGGRDHAAVVGAVADVDALIGALVRPGADQPVELFVEHDLDGASDRLPAPGGEVELEVFLRRDHELGSLLAKESF